MLFAIMHPFFYIILHLRLQVKKYSRCSTVLLQTTDYKLQAKGGCRFVRQPPLAFLLNAP